MKAISSKRRLTALLGAVALLAACSTAPEPFEYRSNREMKPGPGLFSGEDGVFQIVAPTKPETGPQKAGRGESEGQHPEEPPAKKTGTNGEEP